MMSPLFMMCKDGHLYERNHQVIASAMRALFFMPRFASPCPAVHGDLQLLSIGILETDPSEARVARCDACVQRRRL